MKRSWKTTWCGILAAGCAGIANAPDIDPTLAHIIATVGSLLGGIGLMFARDFNVPSEAHGVAPNPIVIAGKTNTTTT